MTLSVCTIQNLALISVTLAKIEETFLYRPSLLYHDTLKLYIQPYWQGWVRAFRVVSRTQTTPASDEPSLEGNDKEGNGDRKRGERYEWRERWVVIHDGVINISKSPKVRLFSFFFFIQPTHSIYRIQIQCVFLSPPSWLSAVQNTFPILKTVPANFNPQPAPQKLQQPR
jgi:hypothetical protein